ncbi:MAG: hypothetical protein ABIT37_10235 [Luteolibacter sp.]
MNHLPGRLYKLEALLRPRAATRTTADFLKQQRGNFQSQWAGDKSIRAKGLPLPLPRGQGLHPTGCILGASSLSFHFRAGKDGDRPALAEFQVSISGLLEAGEATIELEDHWRIDAEGEPKVVAGQPAKEGREPHPRFHFQRGGHAQDAFAAAQGFVPSANTPLGKGEWRALMQYPGPRIPSLPFDPILAIDFCIAQNDGPLWKQLRATPEYHHLIEVSQLELWKPFIARLNEPRGRRDWLGPVVVF